ncbi:MAG: hypothetical protein NC433_08925 [Clostridiales bacterium]|nr:hypothetical protein [Clostridiales bacterium]
MEKNTTLHNYIYGPIRRKVEEWIWYDDHQPKSNYFANREEHDAFRSKHDRDCMLTEGELKADTLFSLWTPLKQTIMRLNDKETIQAVGNISSKYVFLREFIKGDNIERLLPSDESTVQHLSMLFGLGMGRGNVFILPERQLNSARAQKPYYDYVPVFLLESFPGGAFADYWKSPEDYIKWIHSEHLEMLFDGEISPEHIRDLSGSGDVRVSFAPEGINALDRMLSSYVHVLMKREKIYRDLGNKPMDEPYFLSLQELSDEDIDGIYRIDISVAWGREKDPEGKRMKEMSKQIEEKLKADGYVLPSFL